MPGQSSSAALAILLLTLFPSACAGSSGEPGGAEPSELLVSAATSLSDAFTEVESAFESVSPGVDVVLNLGGSSALRQQILQGAPVAVFASANVANMDLVVEAGQAVGGARIFARNHLQIAVPAGNPASVRGLEDLARDELLVGLCARQVPCGDLARQVLDAAGVDAAVDTEEPDVRSLLTKIASGELDAGITYVTDVASSGGEVEGVDIPGELDVVAEYPIAILSTAPDLEVATAFVDFVLSEDGSAILAAYGFDTGER